MDGFCTFTTISILLSKCHFEGGKFLDSVLKYQHIAPFFVCKDSNFVRINQIFWAII